MHGLSFHPFLRAAHLPAHTTLIGGIITTSMNVPPSHPLAPIFEEDDRFALPAYYFVFSALQYAHDELKLGQPDEPDEEMEEEESRHVTGQELCEAIRLYAQDQFGYMAQCVLNSWGIYSTSDFGDIVYNLIRHGKMKKTENDRREDFDDVFDFERDMTGNYKITLPSKFGK